MPVLEANKLNNHTELLFRQVRSEWIQEGRPSSCAFEPNSGDDGLLSSDRGSITTAREAFDAYIALGRQTGGVFAVTVGEYASNGIVAYSDPLEDNNAHAICDFSPFPKNGWKKISRKLRSIAGDRRCQYPK